MNKKIEEQKNKKIAVLLIVDGWGISHEDENNAIFKANTKNFDELVSKYPATLLSPDASSLGNNYKILGNIGVNLSISDIIAQEEIKQIKIAEAEKYTYLSYYFNNCDQTLRKNEDRIIIKSNTYRSYIEKPEMETVKTGNEILKVIKNGSYSFIVASFASIDMVSYFENQEAIIEAIESVDKVIGKIAKATFDKNGTLVLVSCKGGAEVSGKKKNLRPVPFVIANKNLEGKTISEGEQLGSNLSLMQVTGTLANVAPTILKVMEIEPGPKIKTESLL